MNAIELVSFDLCPYVQRSVITLLEKDVPFDITYIDLADKPDWFVQLSPTGKVPVLRVGDDRLFESAVINEYLDETTGTAQLMPEDALSRAKARMWIEFFSGLGGPSYMLMVEPDEARSRGYAAKVHELLGKVEPEIAGPLWDGDDFCLVDAAAAPFLQRIAWIERIAPDLQLTAGLPRVQAWTEALISRPSVHGSTKPDLEAIFGEYLKGGGAPARKAPASWLGTLL